MPKICIDDLNKYLETVVVPPYYKIKADPLLMWHFDGLNKGKEKTITYILNLELSDYCKELITGMGILSTPNYGPYLIKDLPYTTLFVGDSSTINLDEYFKDSDPRIGQLTYEASSNDYVTAISSTPTRSDATITGQRPTEETSVTFTAKDYTNPDASGQMMIRILDSDACLDNDGDYYGRNCAAGDDCDDSNNLINPSATDVPCDGIDQNCDGADAQQSYECYNDADSDGYTLSSSLSTVSGCSRPANCKDKSANADCDDNNANIKPGLTEYCNALDDNCDGATDEGCSCTSGETRSCGSGDCTGTLICSGGIWPSFCSTEGNSCPAQSCTTSDYYQLSANGKTCTFYDYPASCSRNCIGGSCIIYGSCSCDSYTTTSQTLNPSECQYVSGCTGATPASMLNKPSGTACSGGTCDGNGNCVAAATTCSDGTAYGQCSATRPLYCDSGTLIGGCGSPYNCGCASGTCNTVTGFCDEVGSLYVSSTDPLTNTNVCPYTEKYTFSTSDGNVFLRWWDGSGQVGTGTSKWYYYYNDQFNVVSETSSSSTTNTYGNCWAPVRGIIAPFSDSAPSLKQVSEIYGGPSGAWKAEFYFNGVLRGERTFRIT